MPDHLETLGTVDRFQSIKPMAPDKTQAGGDQLKKACQDFESIFVDYMMKQMRKTITRDGFLSPDNAEQLYTSMLDSEVARNVSESRGIGLAAVIYQQMSGIMGNDETKK